MIKIFVIVLLFVSACSFNSSSSLWTKHKKIEYEKSLNIKEINSRKEILKNEINPNVKIRINYKKNNINLISNSNNDGITNYDGQLKKFQNIIIQK